MLPIRRLTLYKHGIAVVERGGAVAGAESALTFHRDQMNDVLKSLVAWDVAGGQIRTIAYDAPEERDAKLARGSIHLSDYESLRDLLRDLRGRRVRIHIAGGESAEGRVVGVDVTNDEPFKRGRVTLLTDGGVRVFLLEAVEGLDILDEQAQADLDFFLRTSVAEPEKRTVTLRLSEGNHDLVVRYLAPSPTWRVSYRLVGSTGEGDERKALVQGWGIFDNPFDEPLENVQMSLVAGMPISFIYDLYTPFMPQRPEVKEEARVAAAPIEMERARGGLMKAGRAAAAPAPMMAMRMEAEEMAVSAAPQFYAGAAMDAAMLDDSTAIAAQGEAQGDRFEYRIGPPVTVQRGEAAMVPILSATIPYRRDHLYNGQKMPKHPTILLRFHNESDLTLERGPITVIEEDSYAGEAILPFSRPNAEITLAISVDLGVTVREERNSQREIFRIQLRNDALLFHEYITTRTRYDVSNDNGEALALLIEHPRVQGSVPFDMPDPDETTDNFYRWRVEVPAGPSSTATFTVQERQEVQRYEQINNLTHESLNQYLRNQWLDQALAGDLGQLLDIYREMQQVAQRRAQLDQEQQRLRAVQEQQRLNLGPLKESGEEAKLRARYVRQLNEAEDAIAKIEQERQQLVRREEELRNRANELLVQLRQR